MYPIGMQEIENSQTCRCVQSREDKGRMYRAEIRIWLGLCGFTVLREKEARLLCLVKVGLLVWFKSIACCHSISPSISFKPFLMKFFGF